MPPLKPLPQLQLVPHVLLIPTESLHQLTIIALVYKDTPREPSKLKAANPAILHVIDAVDLTPINVLTVTLVVIDWQQPKEHVSVFKVLLKLDSHTV